MVYVKEIVLGIDIGTSSVKAIVINKRGDVLDSVSEPIDVINQQTGFSEQNPDDWFKASKDCIKYLLNSVKLANMKVKGISFSGQMHSLVLLDHQFQPLRNAILWNDTRSTFQCEQIKQQFGEYVMDNPVLEGFTLTKLLWVKENEPMIWSKANVFLLPKDYVRFKFTDTINMEYSDGSSTLLMDIAYKCWNKKICEYYGVYQLCPNLIESQNFVGHINTSIADELGIGDDVAVFAGGGDNACGALGAGVINDGDTLCSIGTSGVILACDSEHTGTYYHNIHHFNHVLPEKSYAMGVILAAGDSLKWFQKNIAPNLTYSQILDEAKQSSIGSNGLIYAPYLSGERTPHGDSQIRGSFIGLSRMHSIKDMARAVIEGITFALYESIYYLRENDKKIKEMTSIGGGAKSDFWLQLQADIFNAKVYKLKHEEGPSMGAAMIAAKGVGWFHDTAEMIGQFIQYDKVFEPCIENHMQYKQYFAIYKKIYGDTKKITKELLKLSQ